MVSRTQAYNLLEDEIHIIKVDTVEREMIDAHVDFVAGYITQSPTCQPTRFLVEFVLPGASITPYALHRTRALYRTVPADRILMVAFVIAPGLIARLLDVLIHRNRGRYPQIHEAVFDTAEGAAVWLRDGY